MRAGARLGCLFGLVTPVGGWSKHKTMQSLDKGWRDTHSTREEGRRHAIWESYPWLPVDGGVRVYLKWQWL